MSQVQGLIEQLKRQLRLKGLTYHDVAKRLDVAESTVKRWFASCSFDIERLDDFAEILGVDVSDLFVSSRKRILLRNFTEAQELELAHNEELFSILYLALGGMTSKKILEQFDLTATKLRGCLLTLDRLGLIELHPDDRIVLLIKPNTRWIPNGPLNVKYGSKLRQDFMTTEFSRNQEFYWLVSGKASKATLQVFGKKLEVLLAELQDLMDLDQDLPDSQAPFVTFFAAHRPWKLPIVQLKKRSLKKL